MPTTVATMDPVYLSFTQRDERKPKPKDPNNPTAGEPATRKWLKYYLVAEDGSEVLAATGEDQGDAHYKYHNAPEFTHYGSISFHNRKELIMWLEGVIRQSQGLPDGALMTPSMASGAPGAADKGPGSVLRGSDVSSSMDPAAAAALAVAAAFGAGTGASSLPGVPALPASPSASPRKITPTPMTILPGTNQPTLPDSHWPAYASHRQEKFHHDDGRRAVRFYLVDKTGASTLAVSGDERDNKDGHYIYRTEITLPGMNRPKAFNNMADINRWLEAVVQSCGGTVPFAVDASPKARGRVQNKRALDAGVGHSGRTLGGAAEAAHARRLKALREETDPVTKAANENYLLSLRQAAKATASKREAALKSAQLYLKGVLPKEHQEALKMHKATLKAAADRCNPNKPMRKREARTAPPMPPVGNILEALREVGGLFLPLCEIYSGGLVNYVQTVQSHPERAVAELAANVLGKWRSELAQQLGVLLDPSVLADPCSRLEAAIRSIPPRAPPPRALATKTPRTGTAALALPSPAGSTPRLSSISNSSVRPTPRGGAPTPASIFKVPPPKFDGSGTPSATPVGMAAAPPGVSRAPTAMATLGNPSEPAAAIEAAPGTATGNTQAQKTGGRGLAKAPRPQVGTYADKTVPSGAHQQGSSGPAQQAAEDPAAAPSPSAKAGDKTLPGGNKTLPSFGEKRRPAVAAAASDDDDDDTEMEDEDDEDGGIGSPIGFGELEDMDEDDD